MIAGLKVELNNNETLFPCEVVMEHCDKDSPIVITLAIPALTTAIKQGEIVIIPNLIDLPGCDNRWKVVEDYPATSTMISLEAES
jgi:hypothetical protein